MHLRSLRSYLSDEIAVHTCKLMFDLAVINWNDKYVGCLSALRFSHSACNELPLLLTGIAGPFLGMVQESYVISSTWSNLEFLYLHFRRLI